jgi:predicted molibdopterin-dependent oxidoreductase YjgC
MTDDGLDFGGSRRILKHPVLGERPPTRRVTITFDGRPIGALEAEPVVAALLAAGIRVFRTMPRTGEARGGYCFVGRCADCLLIVDGEPNVMACQVPVRHGMRVETQHGLGTWSATKDVS